MRTYDLRGWTTFETKVIDGKGAAETLGGLKNEYRRALLSCLNVRGQGEF